MDCHYRVPMRRPFTLTIAVLLVWLYVVLSIIAAFAVLAADFSVVGLLLSLFVTAVAVVAAVIAFSLARGHNWARILISVFAVIAVINEVTQIFSGEVLLGIVRLAIQVLVLWFMWNSSSSTYIKVKTAERAVSKGIRG